MKKHISLSMRIVLSLLAFMMTMQMSAESCSLHFSDITINPGGTAEMVVSYETDYENLTGFAFHFALPEGISMTTSSLSNALMQVCPSLTLEYNNQRGDGTIIMCYTFLEKLPSGKHDLMVLTFQADQNVAKQVYTIETTNNQFAYLGANNPNYMENQIFHITVVNQLIPIKRGDVNGDGGTTLQDILILVDYILAGKPSVIDAQNHDIDGDGDVSLSDILIVVDIILNGGAEEQAYLTCPDDHHPHMIDLGLPSGTKWACCNVGADNPEDYGGYYAWGETEEKSNYSWKTYQYCEGTQETCQYLGNISGTVYDVAHVKWGDGWRIPNYDEIDELCTKCSVETITIHNLVYDKYTGPNGNVIIFPYAGFMWYGSNTDIGKELSYWTSDQYPNTPYQAPYLHQTGLTGNRWLFEGLPVRPIYDPSYFTLSDETVDMFVNSTTTVSIESGSGDYELQNDNPDIIDAELILADKNENPDAKDEISIYGVAEGTATLTVLDKQNNKTATVVVNVKTPTDEDVAITKNYVERVRDLINVQEEMPVDDFQNILLEWLEKQDWVKKSVLSANKDLITITFENDVNFIISFQDMSFFDNVDTPNKAPDNTSDIEIWPYYDVSYQDGEFIIDSPNVLFVQCRQMNIDHWSGLYNVDNDIEEKREIERIINLSPVNLKEYYVSKDLQFLGYNWDYFGLILISQTHGSHGGGFQVEDENHSISLGNECISIYYKDKLIVKQEDLKSNNVLYYINPKVVVSKLKSSNATYLGNYCYSYDLSGNSSPLLSGSSHTIIGNTSSTSYAHNLTVSTSFSKKLFLGATTVDAVNSISSSLLFLWNDLFINNNALKRYFSINATEYSNNGIPIVTGKINGYQNLKKSDIKYFIYAIEKGETLKAEDITKGKLLSINSDGTFNYTFSDFNLPGNPDEQQFYVGFEYKNRYYYGKAKGLCTDKKHPHAVDMGLQSKTQWACCNVDPVSQNQTPTNAGGYYAWGETLTKSMYDWSNYSHCDGTESTCHDIDSNICGTNLDVAHVTWKGDWMMPSEEQFMELRNNTLHYWTTINGVNGMVLTSKINGNCIFLPAAGFYYCIYPVFIGEEGHYWAGTLPSDRVGDLYAYSFIVGNSGISGTSWGFAGCFGNTVRPVKTITSDGQ